MIRKDTGITALNILILEDLRTDAELIQRQLEKDGGDYSISVAENEAQFLRQIERLKPDVILSDYHLPGFTGLEALAIARERLPQVVFIIITGSINEATAVDCLHAGANDYILKEHLSRLVPAIHAAREKLKTQLERKKAVAALEASEARYRATVESLHDLIFHIDTKGRFRDYFSARESRFMAQLSPEHFVGQRYEDVLPKDVAEKISRAVTQIKKKKNSQEIVFSLDMPDGQYWLSCTLAGRYERDAFSGVTAVVRDITEQRKDQETRILALESLEHASDAVYWLTADGSIFYINSEACRELGYSREELLKLNALDISPDYTREKWKRHWQLLLRKKHLRFEYVHRRKDGSEFPVEISANLVEHGGVQYNCAFARNISEHKQAEKQIWENHQQLKAVFDSNPLPMIVLDNDRRVVQTNQATLDYTRQIKSDVLGKQNGEALLCIHRADVAEGCGYGPECQFCDVNNALLTTLKTRRHVSGKKARITVYRDKEYVDRIVSVNTSYFESGSGPRVTMAFEDITDREQTLRELEASEERFRQLVDKVTVGIGIHQDGIWKLLNPQVKHMLGYDSLHELIGKPVLDVLHKDYHEIVKQRIKRMAETGQSEPPVEEKLLRKDGSVVPALVSSTPIIWKGRRAFQVTAVDLTPLKQAERIQVVLRNIAAAAVMADNMAILLDRTRQELMEIVDTTNFFVALYNKNTGMMEAPFEKDEEDPEIRTWPREKSLTGYVMDKGKTVVLNGDEIRYLHQTGMVDIIGTLPEIWLGIPLWEEGVAIGAMVIQNYHSRKGYTTNVINTLEVVAQELSQYIIRMRIQETLHDREAQLSHLVEAAQDAIVMIDPEGRIIRWNKAATRIFGYTRDEVYQQSLHKFIVPDNVRSSSRRGFEKFRESGHGPLLNKVSVVQGLRKSGEEFPVELSLAPVHMKDGTYAVGIMHDITDRVEARRKLEQALAEAQRANEVKDIFLANMSHEIRTPLNSIMGYTSLIADTLRDKVPDEQKEFFQIIQQSGKRLMHTIHEMLDMSQIRAGTIKPNPEQCNLVNIVDQVIAELEQPAITKGLQLSFENRTRQAFVMVDEYQVSQAVLNLIDNAVKYTEKGGVTIQLRRLNKRLVLRIADTGIGIDPEYQKHMFEPFTQESEGFTKAYQGIGLGLALTKQYLDLNHVRLELESAPGKGSTFTLFFKPIPTKAVTVVTKQEETAPVQLEWKESLNLLIVEDDPMSRKFLTYMLGKRNKITMTDSVTDARRILKRKAIDMILVDISLAGGGDGLELVRWIRKQSSLKHIPVIATTAHSGAEIQDRCEKAGCDDYVVKPIDRSVLFEKMRQLKKK